MTRPRGRSGKFLANLFENILRDSKGNVLTIDHGRLVSTTARQGEDDWSSFPYAIFETVFLDMVREARRVDRTKKVKEYEIDIATKEEQLYAMKTKMLSRNDKIRPEQVREINKRTADLEKLKARLEMERKAAEVMGPFCNIKDTGEFVSQIKSLDKENREVARWSLKESIRDILTSVILQVHVEGHSRGRRSLGIATVEFINTFRKTYVIRYRRSDKPWVTGSPWECPWEALADTEVTFIATEKLITDLLAARTQDEFRQLAFASGAFTFRDRRSDQGNVIQA